MTSQPMKSGTGQVLASTSKEQQPSAKWFHPLTSKPKRRKIAALDCEGNGGQYGFVCAAVVSDKGRYTFESRKDVLDYIFSKELRDYWIYAHNLEYDLGVFTGGDLRPYRVLFSGNKILSCELVDAHNHHWRLLDSLNILPHCTIKELGLMLNYAKIDLHPLLKSYLERGLPLRALDSSDQRKVLDYCLRDADILYMAITEIQEELLSLGCELKSTVAGIAMDLFRREYMVKPWPVVNPAINKLARSAYFGARVEPFVLGRVSGINGYDISSLYPSVMAKTDFPYPGYLVLDDQPTNFSKIIEREGVSQCTVIVPDDDPPVLPGRIKHHLFFPTGELTQAWPHIELRYALDHGAKIEKVHWSIWSSYTFSPFAEFIEATYKQRLLAASSSKIREQLFKLILNSSYGRYGLNSEDGLQELVALTDNEQWDDLKGATLRYINNWPYALRTIQTDSPPAYANAFIASYVTAAGRIKMHRHIKEHLDRLCYTDTDSLWLTGEMPTGEGLGQFRQVEQNRDFWVVAPKEYAVFSGEHLISATVKGIPEQQRLLYLQSGQATFDAPVGLREGLAKGLAPATWLRRSRSKRYSLPKRPIGRPLSAVGDFSPTRPWAWPELLQAFDLAQAEQPEFVDDHDPLLSHLPSRFGHDQE